MTGLRQNPFPHDGLRLCTFPGHQGENPLPATEEYFPVRKSGPNAGSFVGWCRACQTLSARRYKAEPERQGVRGSGRRPAAPQRSYEQFRDHHAEVEPIRSTRAARSTPSEGPSGPDESMWPSASPERQVLPSGSVRGREQPLLQHQRGTDGSVESWAASWYERLGARPESARYLEAITAWRNAWRPKRVRLLLVAESHVGEQPGDDRISVLPMRWINRPLPNPYVRLIYCLGYGATEICSAVPQSNAGTPQFWNIFGQIALAQSPPTKSSTSLNERLRWKVRVLEELERREIWLQDASPLGVYLGRGQRLDPRHYVRVLQEGYNRFVWPTVVEDDPEQVWVIGKGVYKAIAGMPGIRSDHVISQPQDRNRARHLDGLRRLRTACSA